ncbi:MAG: hypothetical protein ACR2FY_00935 [Pirellulaceae bacterium]
MSLDLQNLNAELRELEPPQLRDRLIYEAVVLKNRGQCDVAAEHGISQPRVSQIVMEVGEWLDRALPRARQSESTSGEMAVGKFVIEAQIDFLLQQTMHDLEQSRKNKVTERSGTRGVVNWTETKKVGGQCAKAGLLNTALRLAQAKAKLAGVDITGRTQREMALAEERQRREAMARGQGTGVRGQEAGVGVQRSEARRDENAKVKKPLIKKNEKSAVAAEIVQPQIQAGQEDKSPFGTEEYIKNEVCKQLIKDLRSDPGCAGWTDEQFRAYAERVWETRPQEGGAAEAGELASQHSADVGGREEFSPRKPLPTPSCPHPGPPPGGEGEEGGLLPAESAITFSYIPRGKTSKRHEMRRRRDKRHSPQERRREFLAPLAAG